MSTRIQLWCVWAGPAFVVCYLLLFGLVGGYVPPQPPSWTAETVKAFYLEHTVGIRIGQIGALVASTLLFPFWAVITGHIARIEKAHRGRPPVLALMQFGGAVLLQVFFALCSMLWIIASYRPELDAATVRVLHDAGWLIFVMVFPGYLMQMICLGVAALIDDDPVPLLPRWAGYLCMWVGLAGVGGGIAVFFTTGPFAWNGFIGFYLPAGVFLVWIAVMTWLLQAGIRRRAEAEAALDRPAGDPRPAYASAEGAS